MIDSVYYYILKTLILSLVSFLFIKIAKLSFHKFLKYKYIYPFFFKRLLKEKDFIKIIKMNYNQDSEFFSFQEPRILLEANINEYNEEFIQLYLEDFISKKTKEIELKFSFFQLLIDKQTQKEYILDCSSNINCNICIKNADKKTEEKINFLQKDEKKFMFKFRKNKLNFKRIFELSFKINNIQSLISEIESYIKFYNSLQDKKGEQFISENYFSYLKFRVSLNGFKF